MSVRLCTAQMHVGKWLKGAKQVLFLDITLKSKNLYLARYAAPDWPLLSRYKDTLDEYEYTAGYFERIYPNINAVAGSIYKRAVSLGITDIVLGCYCKPGAFCHRHLFKRMLLNSQVGFVAGGEVHKHTIYRGDEPKRCIISLTGTPSDIVAVTAKLQYELGNHTMATVEDVVSEAKKAFSRNCMPFIDTSGNVTQSPVCDGDDTLWVCVDCSKEDAYALIKSHLWIPACQIGNVFEQDDEFEAKMDTLYEWGKENA